MIRSLSVGVILIVGFAGCIKIPSSQEIEKDIVILEEELKEAKEESQSYSGGLLSVLSKVRVKILQNTVSMLEQKRSGIKRYIPISYTINGEKYDPPQNKQELLGEIQTDIESLESDLDKAESESQQYGGLLGVLSLTRVSTLKNSIAFLDQKRLLLKHGIPYYSMIPRIEAEGETEFRPTPGNDMQKF